MTYQSKNVKLLLNVAVLELTNYSLSIFCSEADNLHLYIGSPNWCKDQFHFIPHAEHRATQNIVCPTPKANLTLQTHWCLLTVPSPSSTTTRKLRFISIHKQVWKQVQVKIAGLRALASNDSTEDIVICQQILWKDRFFKISWQLKVNIFWKNGYNKTEPSPTKTDN